MTYIQLIKTNRAFTLIELMIVIGIVGLLMAIAIPNFISYRNNTYCTTAEADAGNIVRSISAYFAIGAHTAIIKGDVTFDPEENTWTLAATDPNVAITITLTDISGRCPAVHQTSAPVNAQGDGWLGGNVYQKVIAE